MTYKSILADSIRFDLFMAEHEINPIKMLIKIIWFYKTDSRSPIAIAFRSDFWHFYNIIYLVNISKTCIRPAALVEFWWLLMMFMMMMHTYHIHSYRTHLMGSVYFSLKLTVNLITNRIMVVYHEFKNVNLDREISLRYYFPFSGHFFFFFFFFMYELRQISVVMWFFAVKSKF